MNAPSELKITTSDHKQIRLKLEDCAMYRQFLKLADFQQNEYRLELHTISSEVLELAVRFCKMHETVKLPIICYPIELPFESLFPGCYCELLDLDIAHLVAVAQAASLLQFEPLLDLACVKIATLIRGKSLAEINSLFGGA